MGMQREARSPQAFMRLLPYSYNVLGFNWSYYIMSKQYTFKNFLPEYSLGKTLVRKIGFPKRS